MIGGDSCPLRLGMPRFAQAARYTVPTHCASSPRPDHHSYAQGSHAGAAVWLFSCSGHRIDAMESDHVRAAR